MPASADFFFNSIIAPIIRAVIKLRFFMITTIGVTVLAII